MKESENNIFLTVFNSFASSLIIILPIIALSQIGRINAFTSVLSGHRCLTNTGVEKMYNILI
jgi:hypothetical protein